MLLAVWPFVLASIEKRALEDVVAAVGFTMVHIALPSIGEFDPAAGKGCGEGSLSSY